MCDSTDVIDSDTMELDRMMGNAVARLGKEITDRPSDAESCRFKAAADALAASFASSLAKTLRFQETLRLYFLVAPLLFEEEVFMIPMVALRLALLLGALADWESRSTAGRGGRRLGSSPRSEWRLGIDTSPSLASSSVGFPFISSAATTAAAAGGDDCLAPKDTLLVFKFSRGGPFSPFSSGNSFFFCIFFSSSTSSSSPAPRNMSTFLYDGPPLINIATVFVDLADKAKISSSSSGLASSTRVSVVSYDLVSLKPALTRIFLRRSSSDTFFLLRTELLRKPVSIAASNKKSLSLSLSLSESLSESSRKPVSIAASNKESLSVSSSLSVALPRKSRPSDSTVSVALRRKESYRVYDELWLVSRWMLNCLLAK
mmetsp:Transcript_30415/g.64572  ORF Transcript_30415/g.64572 Transcript_30415/m.64572 type:complete len:373 (+) Transcript_30415:1875-2993(+)